MPLYTYRTVDIKSNRVLEDIDLKGVQFNSVLNGVGDLTADLPVPESKRGLLLDDATLPGRTGLYVLRDDLPVWGGVIWQRDWDEQEAKFRLSCGSWESYAYHVVQTANKTYTNVDQLTIARALLTDSTAAIQTESGIEPPAVATSGMLRVRNMFSYERKTVGLELEQLSGLENGFDYRVESYIKVDGSFGRRYLFGYPRLGRTATLTPSDNSLTFDYPGNLAPFKLTEDAEAGAWRVYATGAGDAAATLLAQAEDTAFPTAGWPRLDAVYSNTDVSVLATLQAHANEQLKQLKPPIDSWTFQLARDSDISLKDVTLGDSAVFRLSSRRWPTAKVMIRRIAEIRVKPPESGALEIVEFGLEEERV